MSVGLNGIEGGSDEDKRGQEDPSKHNEEPTVMKVAPKRNINIPQPKNLQTDCESYPKDHNSLKLETAFPNDLFYGDLKDLEEKVNSMIGRSDRMVKDSEKQMIKAYVCQVCGKEGLGHNIRGHIEATHLRGISIHCNSCDQTYSTRNAVRIHKSRDHNNSLC